MTAYQGGKQRLGKKIYEQIMKYNNNKYNTYFEPFCGMCGVLYHFALNTSYDLIACDINKDIIIMWQQLQKGWIPPETCDKEYYEKIKNSTINSAERGFLGTVCSFSGMFLKGGFRTKTKRFDFLKSGKSKLLNNIKNMQKVKFLNSISYENHKPTNMIIYCDPPYKNNKLTTSTFQNFNYELFWNIMREWSKNNMVIISEKEAPDDFICIWSSEYKVSFLNQNTNLNIKKIYPEKLFIYKDLIY
jgi:DNA adenine methylase